jgi:membrane fusion protein (multidrug efflux system)
MFRQEAVEHYARALNTEGDLLKTPPRWLRMSHWLVLALLLASLAFAIVARVQERGTGAAIIRARRKIVLVATTAGFVRSVEVSGGKRVRKGDVLVRFQDTTGNTATDTVQQLLAPSDGVVTDLQVRPGQQLAVGDQVSSIVDEEAGFELVVLLPGQYAPQIRRGMQIIFKVDGYPDSREATVIDDVGGEILGPQEAARYARSADTLALAGPVVIVRSPLKDARFTAAGTSYGYRDGLTAQVEVNLRSESMILDLLPGLKRALRNLQ